MKGGPEISGYFGQQCKHIILRTNTTLCHFSKPRGQKD
jgi:hypothetical protein